jgi:hypothetical protein
VWFADGKCQLLEDQSWWKPQVAWFQSQGSTQRLLDADGTVVVTLTPGPAPEDLPADALDDIDLDAAYPTPELPPPLPAGVRAPSEQDLVGTRWKPLDVPSSGEPGSEQSADKAFAKFFDDGTWRGSDGCNGQGGTWALNPQTGEWLAVGGATTLIGCANVDVNGAVNGASAVGMDGEELVFYDARGNENGRFAAALNE